MDMASAGNSASACWIGLGGASAGASISSAVGFSRPEARGKGSGVSGAWPLATSNPSEKARFDAATPTPARSMVASKSSRENGSTLALASAPNITALMTLPVRSAIAAMSQATKRCAAVRQASRNAGSSTRPSAMATFSAMA